MAKIRIGKVAPTPKGVYDKSAKYSKLDFVTNDKQTALYMSKRDDNSGHALSDTDWWMCCVNAQWIPSFDYEIVTISLSSNQDEDVTGKTVGLYKSDGSLIQSFEWDGNPITVNVEAGTEYYVKAEARTNYNACQSETMLAVAGQVRAVPLEYTTCKVVIRCSTEDGEGDITKQTLYYKVGTTQKTVGMAAEIVQYYPLGTTLQYWCGPMTGYDRPGTVSFTAEEPTKVVNMQYGLSTNVVGIWDGSQIYTAEAWRESEKAASAAYGVVLKTGNVSILIQKTHVTNVGFGNSGIAAPSGCLTTMNYETARQDFNFEESTVAMVEKGGYTAANRAYSVHFADGRQGYLPTAGVLYEMWLNMAEINDCLSACGGTALSAATWSGTHYNASLAFYFTFSSGALASFSKTYSYAVRAVAAFNN